MMKETHYNIPPRQEAVLRKAVAWEWATIGFTLLTIAVVALVVGNSQSMKTAWIEDMLSLLPQISFLIALRFMRRSPTKRFPYGMQRAMDVGHLVAGVALLVVGLNLAFEAIIGLVLLEHPTIGTVRLFGHTIWLGWLMVAVMAVIVTGPLIYGRAKLKLAPELHNKLLYADADMAKADWQTNAASIVGVLGVGVGLWWLDGAAALFISCGIVWDGVKNTRSAVLDLLDQRARTYEDKKPHPLIGDVTEAMRRQPWVRDVAVRMRDLGQVFHAEVFVVAVKRRPPRTEVLQKTTEMLQQIDWKLQNVVVIPVMHLPVEADRGPELEPREPHQS